MKIKGAEICGNDPIENFTGIFMGPQNAEIVEEKPITSLLVFAVSAMQVAAVPKMSKN